MIAMLFAVAGTFLVFVAIGWVGAQINARRGASIALRKRLALGPSYFTATQRVRASVRRDGARV